MKFLELKIPPVLLILIFAAIMWSISKNHPPLITGEDIRVWLLVSALLIAVSLTLAGALAFKQAQTTVDPTSPESTSALVTTGIYRYTRNPMYVGFFIALIGWGIFLGNAYATLFALIFIPYMNRFQIQPEEQMLTKLFGQQYTDYCQQVRRWC